MMYPKLGLAFLFCVLCAYARASSSVGNGGSMLRANLQETRKVVGALVTKVMEVGRTNDAIYEKICKETGSEKKLLPEFDETKLLLCARFAKEAVSQMLDMVTRKPIVDFALEAELTIDDKPVDAMVRGPEREYPVLFSIKSNRLPVPRQYLFLWLHELGHKVVFEKTYVTDYDPFLEFRKGSDLLDTLAWGLVHYAKMNGLIEDDFSVLDYFKCSYEIGRREVLEFTGASIRQFDNFKESFDAYRTGFSSENPFWSIKIKDPDTREDLQLTLLIKETHGCRSDVSEPSHRYTKLILKGGENSAKVLSKVTLDAVNITCKDHSSERIKLTYRDLTFTCAYQETQTWADKPLPEAVQLPKK